MPRGRVKSSPLVVGTITTATKTLSPMNHDHCASRDRQSVEQTLEAFARAWTAGDEAGMEGCFHPDLTARLVQQDTGDADGRVSTLSRSLGIRAFMGDRSPASHEPCRVSVLDVAGHSASARAVLGDWGAYVHLSRTSEGWAIVNVLWEWNSPPTCRSA